MGATWVHGTGTRTEPNPVLAAALEMGLLHNPLRRQRWWGSAFLVPGRAEALRGEEALKLHTAVEAFSAAVESLQQRGPAASVGAAADAAWRALPAPADAADALAAAAWRWRELLQRAMDGCHSIHDMDAAARAAYSEFGGSETHAALPCGFQAVATALVAGLDCRLGHEVDQIERGPAGVTVSCANGA
jgi:hypothetical protein